MQKALKNAGYLEPRAHDLMTRIQGQKVKPEGNAHQGGRENAHRTTKGGTVAHQERLVNTRQPTADTIIRKALGTVKIKGEYEVRTLEDDDLCVTRGRAKH